MTTNFHHNGQCLPDVCSLALSASQIRAATLHNDQQFSKASEHHSVELTRLDSTIAQSPLTHAFTNRTQLSAYLRSGEYNSMYRSASVDIYFLHQQDTWAPINASVDMITFLMDEYSLNTGFLHILSCFRDRYLSTEESFTGSSRSVFTTERAEFSWVYKYAEKKQVKYGNPWRIRHTGIHHVLDYENERSTIFIISPSPTARFKTYLQQVLRQADVRSTILANPMLVHTMLISFHLHSWQEYLEYHETLLLKLDMKSACTSFEQPSVSFDTLKEIRAVERSILPLEPLLSSFIRNALDLQGANSVLLNANSGSNEIFSVIKSVLDGFRKEAESYRTQAIYLHRRTQSTAQSVLDSLNLGFQQLAQGQSKSTFVMARSAREDSVAIRAITLVTSIYLPFSFVATIFGMNLVDFDSKSRNLLVSKQIWLYFVVSVPLTLLTLACWRCKMQSYREGYLTERTGHEKDTKSLNIASDIEMV